MPWAELNDTVTRYEDTGGDAQPLVLVHEMGGTLNSYDEVLPLLTGRFRVIRYDQRGAGVSAKVRGMLRLEDLSSDVAALLDHLGVDDPVQIAGAAVGACVALDVARRWPDRVAGVVGFSPVTACPEANRDAIAAHADRMEAEGMRALEAASIPNILPQSLWTDDAACTAARLRWLANDPASFAAIYRMFAALDFDTQLPEIATPALMVGATEDGLRPPRDVEAVADRLPHGRFVEKATSHVAAVQTPQLFADTVTGFWDDIRTGGNAT